MNELLPEWFIERMKYREGFRANPYRDGSQISIGYGTQARPGERSITESEAHNRLLVDLAKSRRFVDGIAPDAPEGAKLALTSLTQNAGTKWARDGLGDLVRSGNWPAVQVRLQLYNKQAGRELPGLTARRAEEAGWIAGNHLPITAVAQGEGNLRAPGGAGAPPTPPGNVPVVEQAQSKATRNMPITPQLAAQLGGAANANGLTVRVVSGGQPESGPGRTGSHRHDKGNAADIELYDAKDGHKLNMNDTVDQLRVYGFVRDAVKSGATGVGAGEGYMGPHTLHVGGGTEAVWGAGGKGVNAPTWLRQAHAEGVAARTGETPTQVATAPTPAAQPTSYSPTNTVEASPAQQAIKASLRQPQGATDGETKTTGQGQQSPQRQTQGAQSQGGAQVAKASLGDQIARALGTTSYIDPNTGHQIVNPGGSGEMAMGLTRDFGRPAQNPPASGSPTAPPTKTPSFREAPSVFDTGTKPFPFAPDAAGLLAPPKDTDFSSRTMDLPFTSMKQPVGSAMPLSPFAVPLNMAQAQPWTAPTDVNTFANRFPTELPPATDMSQPVPNLTTFVPTTVQQQMGGLSPFSTTMPQTGIPPIPLLPFEQWSPVGWGNFNIGWGPSSFDFGSFG